MRWRAPKPDPSTLRIGITNATHTGPVDCDEQLTPFLHRVANVGRVGVAGPVALAAARLREIVGDRGAAVAAVRIAEDLARVNGAQGWLRQCAAVARQLGGAVEAPPSPFVVPLEVVSAPPSP